MADKTIKAVIAEALEDLSPENFNKFRHALRDRKEEPRVRRKKVDDKDYLDIADVLVSTFTETKAVPVVVDLLRQINCNEEAKTLYSITKPPNYVDKGDPTFPKTSTGKLDTEPSQEAQRYANSWQPLQDGQRGSPPMTEKKQEEVEAEAKARVLSEGGDTSNKWLVLSRYTIEFGQYKGQTFKWLLENHVGYVAWFVANHQKGAHTKHRANKDSLTKYAITYPEVMSEVRFHRGYQRSLQSGKDGNALVGFGVHRQETLRDLYNSKDPEKIRYVDFLRTKKSTCDPGSKMEIAIKYILQRDKQQAAPTRRRLTKRKRVCRARAQPIRATGPTWRKQKRCRRTKMN